MPWASTAIRCDQLAIVAFSVLSFAFAPAGAQRASARERPSTAGTLRLGAGRASGVNGLVVGALVVIVLVVAVTLLAALVVLAVTLFVVTLLVFSLPADVLRSVGDGIRGVL